MACAACDALKSLDPRQLNEESLKDAMGRITWGELHAIAAAVPLELSSEERERIQTVVLGKIYGFPCPECVTHSKAYLERRPLDFSSRATLQQGLCEFHNAARRAQGKELTHACDFTSVEVSPKDVLEAIRRYETEYGAPASISDIQFLLTIPHGSPVDKQIDAELAKAAPEKVQKAVDELVSAGNVKRTEFGGYVNPDYPARTAKPFNIAKPSRNTKKMASDIVLIAGSQLAAKGTEKIFPVIDKAMGLRYPWNLKSIVGPIVGAAGLVYAWKKGSSHSAGTQLALTSYSAHLLMEGVDTVETVLLPGLAQGLSIRAIPGMDVNPTSGFGRRLPVF